MNVTLQIQRQNHGRKGNQQHGNRSESAAHVLEASVHGWIVCFRGARDWRSPQKASKLGPRFKVLMTLVQRERFRPPLVG